MSCGRAEEKHLRTMLLRTLAGKGLVIMSAYVM